MRILIANDDGIYSPGIATLARVHTAADTTVGMTAVGIVQAAGLIAEAVALLQSPGE